MEAIRDVAAFLIAFLIQHVVVKSSKGALLLLLPERLRCNRIVGRRGGRTLSYPKASGSTTTLIISSLGWSIMPVKK